MVLVLSSFLIKKRRAGNDIVEWSVKKEGLELTLSNDLLMKGWNDIVEWSVKIWRAGTDIVEWSVKKWKAGTDIVEKSVKKWWAGTDVVEWSIKKWGQDPTLSIQKSTRKVWIIETPSQKACPTGKRELKSNKNPQAFQQRPKKPLFFWGGRNAYQNHRKSVKKVSFEEKHGLMLLVKKNFKKPPGT
jgi:phage-related protein